MAFRPSLPPFILESAALRSQGAWTLMAQALLTGLVSGGVIGLFRWLYTIINTAMWPDRIPWHRPRWPCWPPGCCSWP